MKKRTLGLIIILAIGVLMLTACERSATRASRDSAATDGEIPFPVSTQSQIMVDILAATQTALAAGDAVGGEVAQPPEEPQPVSQPTAMPEPEEEESEPEPEPTPGMPATYTIQKDEFLFCIARRLNVNASEFLAINGLGVDYYAQVGDRLTVPQSGKPFDGQRALRAHPADYTVVAGDSIGKIACYFGDVSPEAIYDANDLEAGTALQPGQVIHIP
ncbi:MAG TPA: LysM peptidoglycan-binding domain-containing protein [Anaerolineaceae bacterium]|nr:LysM peptidoglycan-binding domain-containing protein [Anaerolineaceae bacterium]